MHAVELASPPLEKIENCLTDWLTGVEIFDFPTYYSGKGYGFINVEVVIWPGSESIIFRVDDREYSLVLLTPRLERLTPEYEVKTSFTHNIRDLPYSPTPLMIEKDRLILKEMFLRYRRKYNV